MASTNTAYDYERAQVYEPVRTSVAQPPELRVVEGRAVRSRMVFRRAAVFFVFMIAMLAAVLYNRMILTELTTQVANTRSEYESLVSENRRMQVELESKTSLRTIQQSAEEIGMAKAESYQIEYVDLGQQEQVLLTQEADGAVESTIAAIGDFFSSLFGN